MTKAELRLESKQFNKKLTTLAAPLVAQEVLGNSVNLLDSFLVGSLGLNAINGVGFANQIYFLLSLALFGINSGSGIFMGQFWGKGDAASVRKTLGLAVCVCMLPACLFAAAAWTAPETIIGIYAARGADGVIVEGVKYIRVAAVTYFLCALIFPINTALKACNQTKLPLFTTTISLFISASCSIVFIFVFHWGVIGCAAATVIARGVELTCQLTFIVKLRMPIFGKFADYVSAKADFLKEYFRRALPVMCNEVVWAIGTSLYVVAYKFTGNEGQGAQQIAAAVQSVFMSVGFAVGSGCGIILANTLGAGENEKAVRYAYKSTRVGLLVAAVIGSALAAAAPFIVRIYDVSDDIKRAAMYTLFVIAATFSVRVYNFITICGILRSGGDTKFCLYLDLFSTWVVGVGAAFFAAAVLRLPIYWVVTCVTLEEAVKTVLSTWRVRKGIWAKTLV